MEDEKTSPKPCDPEIFSKGEGICILDAPSWPMEHWVQRLSEKSGEKLDWHYMGGRAILMHIGTVRSHRKVQQVIREMDPDPEIRILSFVDMPEESAVFVLQVDSDMTLRSSPSPIGYAVTSEEEAKKWHAKKMQEGASCYDANYVRVRVLQTAEEVEAYQKEELEDLQKKYKETSCPA